MLNVFVSILIGGTQIEYKNKTKNGSDAFGGDRSKLFAVDILKKCGVEKIAEDFVSGTKSFIYEDFYRQFHAMHELLLLLI